MHSPSYRALRSAIAKQECWHDPDRQKRNRIWGRRNALGAELMRMNKASKRDRNNVALRYAIGKEIESGNMIAEIVGELMTQKFREEFGYDPR
jgi:hypothetical protein